MTTISHELYVLFAYNFQQETHIKPPLSPHYRALRTKSTLAMKSIKIPFLPDTITNKGTLSRTFSQRNYHKVLAKFSMLGISPFLLKAEIDEIRPQMTRKRAL